jgi:MoxR-like ATPase
MALTEQKVAKEAIAVALRANVPTLLWGNPGVGKSRFIEKLGRELGFEVFTIIGSTLDPTDIRGLPYRTENGTQFERPYFLKVAAEKPSLIFLDELTAAPPAIWAALCVSFWTKQLTTSNSIQKAEFLALATRPK